MSFPTSLRTAARVAPSNEGQGVMKPNRILQNLATTALLIAAICLHFNLTGEAILLVSIASGLLSLSNN